MTEKIVAAAVPTHEQFRTVGFTEHARFFPRDELALLMLAAFNNAPADCLSDAFRYFPNEATKAAWTRVADAAWDYFCQKAKVDATTDI